MEPILGAAPRTQAWKAYVLLLNYIGIILGKYLIFPNFIFINVGRVSGTRTHTVRILSPVSLPIGVLPHIIKTVII